MHRHWVILLKNDVAKTVPYEKQTYQPTPCTVPMFPSSGAGWYNFLSDVYAVISEALIVQEIAIPHQVMHHRYSIVSY